MQSSTPPALPVLILLHLMLYGALLLLFQPGAGPWALILCALLVWISLVDLRAFVIPDTASAALTITGLAQLWSQPPPERIDALVGAVFWPLAFWAVAHLYRQHRERHGLGFGDVKLMVGLGLWCGFTGSVWVVLGAALAGMLVLSVSAIVSRTKLRHLGGQAVAFGPFLCLSAWWVWLTGT